MLIPNKVELVTLFLQGQFIGIWNNDRKFCVCLCLLAYIHTIGGDVAVSLVGWKEKLFLSLS